MKIKKSQLIKWHIYAGLFTAIYMLAFATSSLILNHQWEVANKEVTHKWESKVDINPSLNDEELSVQIRDNLGLMGWTPPWKFQRDSRHFRFEVTHFGMDYRIDTELATGNVKINEISKGFLATFHGLHFFNGNIPNAPFLLRSWAIYQWLTLAVMVVSLVLGLWLWIKFSFQRWHLVVFGGIFLGSIILMMVL